jgi:hypothetical protein
MGDDIAVYTLPATATSAGHTLNVDPSHYQTVVWQGGHATASTTTGTPAVVDLGAELEKVNMRMDQLDQKLEMILELLETRKA